MITRHTPSVFVDGEDGAEGGNELESGYKHGGQARQPNVLEDGVRVIEHAGLPGDLIGKKTFVKKKRRGDAVKQKFASSAQSHTSRRILRRKTNKFLHHLRSVRTPTSKLPSPEPP